MCERSPPRVGYARPDVKENTMADDIREDRPTGSTSGAARVERTVPADTAHPTPTRSRTNWPAILGSLLLGLVLGSWITWAATRGDEPPPQASPTTSPTAEVVPTPSAATQTAGQVAVPQSCLQIAEESGRLNEALTRGVAAARDLDASAMSSIVRDFGAQQEKIQQLAEQCRQSAQTPQVVTTTG